MQRFAPACQSECGPGGPYGALETAPSTTSTLTHPVVDLVDEGRHRLEQPGRVVGALTAVVVLAAICAEVWAWVMGTS